MHARMHTHALPLTHPCSHTLTTMAGGGIGGVRWMRRTPYARTHVRVLSHAHHGRCYTRTAYGEGQTKERCAARARARTAHTFSRDFRRGRYRRCGYHHHALSTCSPHTIAEGSPHALHMLSSRSHHALRELSVRSVRMLSTRSLQALRAHSPYVLSLCSVLTQLTLNSRSAHTQLTVSPCSAHVQLMFSSCSARARLVRSSCSDRAQRLLSVCFSRARRVPSSCSAQALNSRSAHA